MFFEGRLGLSSSRLDGQPRAASRSISAIPRSALVGRVMTEAMPTYAGTVTSKPSANGLRTVLNFQRVGSQRYFDAAGFPGRTLGLEAEGGKQKTAGK